MKRKTTLGDVATARKEFGKLVDRAAEGEEIVIAKDGKPIGRLVPYEEPRSVPKRKPGSMRGKIKVLPGFDEADAEIAEKFGRS